MRQYHAFLTQNFKCFIKCIRCLSFPHVQYFSLPRYLNLKNQLLGIPTILFLPALSPQFPNNISYARMKINFHIWLCDYLCKAYN